MGKIILFLAIIFTPVCAQGMDLADAFRYAEEQSPFVRQARGELEQSRARVEAAGVWQNPELDLEAVYGSSKSGEKEFALGVPLEPGKISARRRVAEGTVLWGELKLSQARAQARGELRLKLHRLRQIMHEQEVIEESITTFSKMVAQYRGRKGLSPEQNVSASVFQMAKSEYDLKKLETEEELLALSSYFRLHANMDLEAAKKIAPSSPIRWPVIGEATGDSVESIALKLAGAELKIADGAQSLAQAEAWPTVILGPSMKILSENGRAENLYGFNLSLPLPIFNRNGGNKGAAQAGVTMASAARDLAQTREKNERRELWRSYTESVKILSGTLLHAEIEKKHTEIEKLFLRGVVPSALVIEAHRSFVELEKSRNERELKTLSNFLTIQAIDGKTAELNL